MSGRHLIATLALFAAACSGPTPSPAAATDEPQRAAPDPTTQLLLHGQLDTAAVARGVHAVTAWWTPTGSVAAGEVDDHGALHLPMPAGEANMPSFTPILHVVDRAGGHWYCALVLVDAPRAGTYDLGDVELLREPDAPTVVDEHEHPLAGAFVLLAQHGSFLNLRAVTDRHGIAAICRGAPFDYRPLLFVRHPDFAPWWGRPAARVHLDHGGEIRGRVMLPAVVRAEEYAAHAWIAEAAPPGVAGAAAYADVAVQLADDGSFRLRNVPFGQRDLFLQSDATGRCSSIAQVEVGPEPTMVGDVERLDLAFDDRLAGMAIRIHLRDVEGEPVGDTEASIHVSDVGCGAAVTGSTLYWDQGCVIGPFAICVPGYEEEFGWHRNSETVTLRRNAFWRPRRSGH